MGLMEVTGFKAFMGLREVTGFKAFMGFMGTSSNGFT